ncbi:hypothetical protein ACM26V_11975 [Salipaludibacillus sp. HK11]|uniref:hypothetical protein n=1 Tax=Salipaludibacillus sp. HK11 TaxID=3394320 RepID=UPI0039FD7D25
MNQKIQAFFKSENDAESANMKLVTANVSNQFVDELPPNYNSGKGVILVPALNSTTTGSGGALGTGTAGTFTGALHDLKDPAERNNFTHILEFEVDVKDVGKALDVLKDTEAYVDENILKE